MLLRHNECYQKTILWRMIEVENINHSVNQCHMMKRVKKKPAHFVSLYALSLDHMVDIILSRDRMLIILILELLAASTL